MLKIAKEKKVHFLYYLFCPKKLYLTYLFYLNVYSVLNTLSKYTYFYISKNITSYTFLLVFKIVESLHCILEFIWVNFHCPVRRPCLIARSVYMHPHGILRSTNCMNLQSTPAHKVVMKDEN